MRPRIFSPAPTSTQVCATVGCKRRGCRRRRALECAGMIRDALGVTRSWLTSPDPFDIVFELLYLLLEFLNSPFDALPLNLW
jgi:hypothetical protein